MKAGNEKSSCTQLSINHVGEKANVLIFVYLSLPFPTNYFKKIYIFNVEMFKVNDSSCKPSVCPCDDQYRAWKDPYALSIQEDLSFTLLKS